MSREVDPNRKARGAFFTPPAIADYLVAWAVGDDPSATVLDPTCGEAVFLLAAARRLRQVGCPTGELDEHVFGVDLHQESLATALTLLRDEGLDAHLIEDDFFDIATPAQLGSPLPEVDAVIGNPPFVRYQEHRGEARRRAAQAALAQGVQLSGLASSWAALLVHACGFLKQEGRLAMVVPAELLTVQYAEPIRRWLRERFTAVHLVMFERLQFADALEKVMLLVARGSGGCESFSLYQVENAQDLAKLRPFDHLNVTPPDSGKWTDVLLTSSQRRAFRLVTSESFVPLAAYGTVELGTVTGANDFFALSEETRLANRLNESQVTRISPPGTRHLKGLAFTEQDWEECRRAGDAVWLLYPHTADMSAELQRYVQEGEQRGIDKAYKCRIRTPWWRPPVVKAPDLFFTYMSHRYPRLIQNRAGTTFLNSMHGVTLGSDRDRMVREALPLLCLNTVTMLGAEVNGRSYGGGILKMEPREAAQLPLPGPVVLRRAWAALRPQAKELDALLRAGAWESVVARVDEELLVKAINLQTDATSDLIEALSSLRDRRLGG